MSVAFHFSAPELLTESHQNLLGEFDCGIDELNRWLTEKALGNQFRGVSRTYVTLSVQGDVAGFYSLSNFALSHQYLSARYKRNMPNPIPCCLLGRLAVAQKYQGMRLGPELVMDALTRVKRLSEISGCWALVVQPKGPQQASFYNHLGFVQAKHVEPPLRFFEVQNL